MIARTVFCCATDDSRPILRGCLLEAKTDKLQATALDGFRMAFTECQASAGVGEMEIVCPARTLIEISRMLEGGDEPLKIYADKNLMFVAVKNTVITSRLYTGKFIARENIYPTEFTSVVNVKRAEMVESIERASILIRNDKNNLIWLDIKNGKIVVTANSEMGKVEEAVDGSLEGKEIKIAVNYKFILDALKALDEETVTISLLREISPFVLKNGSGMGSKYLVLPLRAGSQS